VKVKHFKKVSVHDNDIVAFNADKEENLNSETSINGNSIASVSMRCPDSNVLNPGMIVLKENANLSF